MQIGVTTFLTDESPRGTTLGRALEERGFASLFLSEHSHIPASRLSPYPGGGELPRWYYRTLDPFVALSAVAVATERLLLGTGVALLAQRDVIHTAKQVASLDLISQGRAILGVGVGWNREEMSDHGTDPRTRGALIDEQLEALVQLWTAELAEYHGRFVNFDPCYAWPKPVRQPHPPIYVGGGDAGARRAVRHNAGWLPHGVGTPDEVPAQLARFAELGGGGLPVVVGAINPDPALLEAYSAAGVEQAVLSLPTAGESDTLHALDELADVAAPYLR